MSQKHRSIGIKAPTETTSAREESPAIQEILSRVNDRCAKQFRIFIRASERANRGHLADMWEQGRVVETVRDKEYRSPREGEGLVNTIAALAQIAGCSESYLNKMSQFYRLCPTEPQKKEVLSLRLANGNPLIYAHWEQLVKFAPAKPEDSRAELDALLAKTIENSWSPMELAGHIKMAREAAQKTQRGGGRPTTIPPTFHGRLAKVVKQTGILLKSVREIYSHQSYNLYEALKALSQEEIAADSDNLMAGVKALATNLRDIGDWCQEMLDDAIPDVSTHIQKCACSHAEQAGRDAAAAIEAEDDAA